MLNNFKSLGFCLIMFCNLACADQAQNSTLPDDPTKWTASEIETLTGSSKPFLEFQQLENKVIAYELSHAQIPTDASLNYETLVDEIAGKMVRVHCDYLCDKDLFSGFKNTLQLSVESFCDEGLIWNMKFSFKFEDEKLFVIYYDSRLNQFKFEDKCYLTGSPFRPKIIGFLEHVVFE